MNSGMEKIVTLCKYNLKIWAYTGLLTKSILKMDTYCMNINEYMNCVHEKFQIDLVVGVIMRLLRRSVLFTVVSL